MSGNYAIPLYGHRTLSASAAFFIHAALFLLGGAMFSHSAQYGIELGQGGLEVHLIAAPPMFEALPAAETSEEEVVVVDKSAIAEPQPLPRQVVPQVHGDGSSPAHGKDTTTLHTAGGAETLAQPNYLKNPAPRYPEGARRAGQQGVVLLLVHVNNDA